MKTTKMKNKTYEDAQELLDRHLQKENLKKHCYAVESAMTACAKRFADEGRIPSGNDELEKWKIVGLLHDFDYEKYPDKHPQKGAEILKEEGWSEEIVRAVLSHANFTGVPRESLLEKTLFAVDELTGFIVACALVRPGKLDSLTAKDVIKKMKSPAFAQKVSREDIKRGAEELGAPIESHIQTVIQSMRSDSRLGL